MAGLSLEIKKEIEDQRCCSHRCQSFEDRSIPLSLRLPLFPKFLPYARARCLARLLHHGVSVHRGRFYVLGLPHINVRLIELPCNM